MWSNHTINSFAHQIGLARAENLYQIKRGNYGISFRIADMIVERFPEISKPWLLTGEGEMLVADGRGSVVVPFYDEDVGRTAGDVGGLQPASDIVLPRFLERCRFAMRCDAESAAGRTTLLLLRRCVGGRLRQGEYIVRGPDGTGRIVTIEGDGPDAELHSNPYAGSFADAVSDDRIVCEVVGRITFNGPAGNLQQIL